MALYYTIDEFIETISLNLKHLNVYQQFLASVMSKESEMLARGDDFDDIETEVQTLLFDSDGILDEVQSALNDINFANYALEIRAGLGGYSYARLFNAGDGPPITTWTLSARDNEDTLFAAFGTILSTSDVVEIFGVGDSDYEGFFTIITKDTTLITLAEAAQLTSGDVVSPADNVIIRLRER